MSPLLGNRAAFDTNPLDDTRDSSNPAQDVFNQFSGTVSSISTAAIVGIVVVVVAVIVLAILTFWLLRRKQRQRQQRRNMEEQHKTTTGIAPVHTSNNQHLSPGVPDYYTQHEMEQHGGHNPWPNTSGAAVVPSPRFEAQDTGLREAPGTAASPQYQGSSAPQPELHGIESRRQELP